MRFKVDENLPAEVAESLRASGHVADTVEDEGFPGAPDEKVVAASAADGRVLFTLDKGIATGCDIPQPLIAASFYSGRNQWAVERYWPSSGSTWRC